MPQQQAVSEGRPQKLILSSSLPHEEFRRLVIVPHGLHSTSTPVVIPQQPWETPKATSSPAHCQSPNPNGIPRSELTRSPRTIDVPFPTARLASIALKALGVDKELSPLVRRTLTTVAPPASPLATGPPLSNTGADKTILRTEYAATTNRMLRVAVNTFLASLVLVLEVMEELDSDVLDSAQTEKVG